MQKMISAYKEFWSRYVDFEGKTSRGNFWWAFLAGIIVSFIIGIVASILGLILPILSTLITSLFSLANLIPSIAIVMRRLRDAGYAWYNIFWVLLPIAGEIILIVLLAKEHK